MSTEFTRGLQEVADDVARAHAGGPGLPVERIDARSRRLRRRHDATLVIASAAALAVMGLGGAALLDRPWAPPAGDPTDTPGVTETPTADPTPSPDASPAPNVSSTPEAPPTTDPPTAPTGWGADDMAALLIDSAQLGQALPELAGLQPVDVPWGEWAMHPDVEVFPTEACRPAITVVLEEPAAFRRVGWSSDAANVRQELVVLADAAAAQAAFAELGTAHQECPEYGASVPESSGAWFTAADVAADEAGLPSYRIAGTESGEGHATPWVVVDVLVDNVIVRTEVLFFGRTTTAFLEPATPAEATAVGDAVERAIEAAEAARQS